MRTKSCLLLAIIMSVLICRCIPCQAQAAVDFKEMSGQLLSIITNKSTSHEDLLQAISRLGRVTEPPSIWRSIADDSNYSLRHRTRAIFSLFRRHCSDVWTCVELRNVIAPAKWARESRIEEIDHVVGWIPVEVQPSETVFRISVLNGPFIYLRLAGKVDIHVFSSLLRGDSVAPPENPTILQYAFGDDYDEWYFNRKRPSRPGLPSFGK